MVSENRVVNRKSFVFILIDRNPIGGFVVFTGTVLSLEGNDLRVRHYDGIESVIPREESYLITPDKFERDCQYILHCEERLVGQAVVARNDKDGMFYLGT